MYSFRSRGQPQPVAPFVGEEQGITWYWVAGLDIQIPHPQGQGAPLNIAPHPIHNEHVAADRQIFYGSFTLVTADGQIHPGPSNHWTPTQQNHTEPQYYQWIGPQIAQARAALAQQVSAVIYEVNQTNTPCSQAGCRPAILATWLAAYPGVLTIARMSAYQLYESQYPAFLKSSMEFKQALRTGTTPPFVQQNAVVHNIPEKYGE